MNDKRNDLPSLEPAAGNGLLNRRIFLEGALLAGATTAGLSAAAADPLPVAPWMKKPGPHFAPYGMPSSFESKVVRAVAPPNNPLTAGVGSSRTPHHLLEGMMTPSGLHFERSHSGIPDIDPEQHRLVIHGLVKRPLVFTLDPTPGHAGKLSVGLFGPVGDTCLVDIAVVDGGSDRDLLVAHPHDPFPVHDYEFVTLAPAQMGMASAFSTHKQGGK